MGRKNGLNPAASEIAWSHPLDSSFGATFYANYYKRAVNEFDYRLQITLSNVEMGNVYESIKCRRWACIPGEGSHFQHLLWFILFTRPVQGGYIISNYPQSITLSLCSNNSCLNV